MKGKSLIRIAIATLCGVASVANAQAPTGSTDQQPMRLAVASQPIAAALNEFARQSGLQVVIGSDVAAGVKSAPVEGALTPRAALDQMLKDTGLRYEYIDSSTIAVLGKEKPRAATDGRTTHRVTRPAEFRLARLDQEQTAGDGQVESSAASSSGVDGERRMTLEEVIVTAQKREQSLQDVPISIAVLSGAQLDASTDRNVTDALRKVPGVSIAPAVVIGGGSSLTLRGVGASANVFNGSSPIAYYVDGVPFGFIKSAMMPDAGSYDLDRIEVLRGPQGTLYGANALNGVVRVLTRDADPAGFDLKSRVSSSSTQGGEQSYRADVALNLPLVEDRLAMRVSGGIQDLGGYIDRPSAEDVNDGRIEDVRLKVNATPVDGLELGASVWHSRTHYDDKSASQANYLFPFARSVLDSLDTEFDAYNLKAQYDGAKFSIVSATSHVDYSSRSPYDLTIFAPSLGTLNSLFRSKITSQELLVNSVDDGGFIWSVGGFYRDVADLLVQEAPYLVNPIDFTDQSESFAAFGQATVRLLDGKFELTGGLRYFTDKVTQIENRPSDGDTSRPLLRDSDTFHALTPKVELSFHPSSTAMLYASYGQGFRSGFNQNANVTLLYPQIAPAKPDELSNYEVGVKGTLLASRIRYEAAIYYVDWQDTQQTIFVPIPGSGNVAESVSAVLNAVSASGLGVDGLLSARVTDTFEVGATFSMNDITADENLDDALGRVISKGDRLNFSPEYTAGAFAEYVAAVGGGGNRLRFNVSANYTSKQISQGVGFYSESEDFILSSFSMALLTPRSWTISAFVDNIFDENKNTMANCCSILQVMTRPRTVGLQLEYRLH